MIQVILLEKVTNLGEFGQIVRVHSGYARNYLIPKRIARLATESCIQEFELQRAELMRSQLAKLDFAKNTADRLSGLSLMINRKSRPGGRLYGSVTEKDIADDLKVNGFSNIEKSCVHLPDGPIKNIGEYLVTIFLGPDISQKIKVQVN